MVGEPTDFLENEEHGQTEMQFYHWTVEVDCDEFCLDLCSLILIVFVGNPKTINVHVCKQLKIGDRAEFIYHLAFFFIPVRFYQNWSNGLGGEVVCRKL